MADKRRFDAFARWITERFAAPRVFDVAGGQGRLNEALTALGRDVVTFDRKAARNPRVAYRGRRFTLEEPCACDLVAGMHPDGATRVIVEYAAAHAIPFAIVPCCSDNGMSYGLWMKHLAALARERFGEVEEAALPIEGRARVLFVSADTAARRGRGAPESREGSGCPAAAPPLT